MSTPFDNQIFTARRASACLKFIALVLHFNHHANKYSTFVHRVLATNAVFYHKRNDLKNIRPSTAKSTNYFSSINRCQSLTDEGFSHRGLAPGHLSNASYLQNQFYHALPLRPLHSFRRPPVVFAASIVSCQYCNQFDLKTRKTQLYLSLV